MEKTEYLAVYTVVIFEAEDESWGEHIREVWKDQNGDIHRDGDEPAIICKDVKTGEIIQREWYQNGLKHRDDGKPALIRNAHWGINEEYYVNDARHRENGPAIYQKTIEGVVIREDYFVNDKWHRLNGPTIVMRSDRTGVVESESYHINGLLSRDDGPAYIERCEDSGIATYEVWCKSGKDFRPDGKPHEIKRHYQTGEVTSEVYGDTEPVSSLSGPT